MDTLKRDSLAVAGRLRANDLVEEQSETEQRGSVLLADPQEYDVVAGDDWEEDEDEEFEDDDDEYFDDDDEDEEFDDDDDEEEDADDDEE